MSPSKAISAISQEWQAAMAIAGAVAFGAAVAAILSGFLALPAKVEAQGDAIVETKVRVSRLQRNDSVQTADLRWVRCVLSAQLSKTDPIGRCGL